MNQLSELRWTKVNFKSFLPAKGSRNVLIELESTQPEVPAVSGAQTHFFCIVSKSQSREKPQAVKYESVSLVRTEDVLIRFG